MGIVSAQDYEKLSQEYRNELSREYKAADNPPLSGMDKVNFKALKFYDFNPDFVIEARFEALDNTQEMQLNTSKPLIQTYTKYGYLHFQYEGKQHKLLVLQAENLKNDPEYYNYLSVYFTDETNGKGSYKMGRYMELRAPLEETLVLNFNNTYNPYCAYSDRYACPVPPKENKLPFAIEAGVKTGFHGKLIKK
ncbi:hypothetical protein NMS_1704 [Nonlabens marinus S1-08]|uniref:DUF1684 domain-containing protein n=1 Tax=Nonlabens marinus S1-08 TaxID=1454201 RepID=W8VVT1_9FLAO|nr:hypothetical protein NMS_1704 [Nonlabens marinus S1-08]